MPYIETRDETELYVKEWGDGRPVILIHGWPLSADSWDPVANALAESGYRAISYDRRGFGRSEQPFTGYDYDTFADDLADVMECMGAEEDVSLVGFSMGGGEVARYMSRHGGKGVVSAALVGSVVPYMLQTDDNPDGLEQKQFDAMIEGIGKDRPAFFASFFKAFFGVGMLTSPVSDEVLNWAWGIAMQAGLKPTTACIRAFGETDFRPDLAAFRVPTLVIHGTGDAIVPAAIGRNAAAGIAGARLIEYDGAPHGLFAAEQDRLIGDLLGFLGTTTTARSALFEGTVA
ncbi:MAG: alpha/beta hydrolase [Pseudomonadota bacterium]